MSAPGWEGILDEGETILWQGQPVPGVQLEFGSAFEPFFFLFFTGFSIFWMVMASQAGGLFWTFGLLFFAVGSYNLVLQHFWKAFLRRNTYYTLTNRRAFIAERKWNGIKTLESHPIHADTSFHLEDSGAHGSVVFKEIDTRNMNGQHIRKKVGFLRIADPGAVMQKMRQIQKAAS